MPVVETITDRISVGAVAVSINLRYFPNNLAFEGNPSGAAMNPQRCVAARKHIGITYGIVRASPAVITPVTLSGGVLCGWLSCLLTTTSIVKIGPALDPSIRAYAEPWRIDQNHNSLKS